jgi:hypothetical protein
MTESTQTQERTGPDQELAAKRLKKVGDLSAVTEEPNHLLNTTQEHPSRNASQEPSSDVVVAPL